MNPVLRKNKPGHQPIWTNEELLAGFNHFLELYGHYPSSHEIDEFPYLPSARSIQRTHGGLIKLRQTLIPEEHPSLASGVYRSIVAKRMWVNGRDLEDKFYKQLVSNFKQISVHEHRLIRPAGVSSDFFIYLSETDGAVIDIFYAHSMRNLVNIVNIKLKRYLLIDKETYLVVVGNSGIEHESLLSKMQNKRIPLPSHVQIVSEQYFFDVIMPKLKARSQFVVN